jgi:hypothetical protein
VSKSKKKNASSHDEDIRQWKAMTPGQRSLLIKMLGMSDEPWQPTSFSQFKVAASMHSQNLVRDVKLPGQTDREVSRTGWKLTAEGERFAEVGRAWDMKKSETRSRKKAIDVTFTDVTYRDGESEEDIITAASRFHRRPDFANEIRLPDGRLRSPLLPK